MRDEKLLAVIVLAVIVAAVLIGCLRPSGGFLVDILIGEAVVGSIYYYMWMIFEGPGGSGDLLLIYLSAWFIAGYVVWWLLRGFLSDRIGNFWVEYGCALGIVSVIFFWITGAINLMILAGVFGFLLYIAFRR
ncbi:MAG: hypothetical protein DRJ38_03980 [Thermoprotei archaeon]|nr:MAG: hypothetical protein DRJ38_03980 [Thermoprotei archaeon]